VTLPASTEVIPEHTVTSASYVAYGEHSGSHASSGDPFDVSWYGQVAPVTDVTGNLVKPLANPFSVTMTAVPEPQAYAMAIGGLAVVGALARRRRRQTV
jgi:MYXO-CTERM domain-containing protein